MPAESVLVLCAIAMTCVATCMMALSLIDAVERRSNEAKKRRAQSPCQRCLSARIREREGAAK